MSRFSEGVCPECGGDLFTTDGVTLVCETCDYSNADVNSVKCEEVMNNG